MERDHCYPQQTELSPESRGLFALATVGYRLALDAIERERKLPAAHRCDCCAAIGADCTATVGHTGNVRAVLTAREGL
jgi:hypothetical protein